MEVRCFLYNFVVYFQDASEQKNDSLKLLQTPSCWQLDFQIAFGLSWEKLVYQCQAQMFAKRD